MPDAKTLRQLAGLPAEPARLADSAVVMIDCQNTYRSGVMALVGVEEALKEGRRLLDRARDAGAPVIHIQHDSGPGSPYDIRAEIGQIADLVAPAGDEPVIVKHKPNSFFETDLDAQLKALGKEKVIYAGFMTHMCINSTARAGFNLGHQGTVVASATATRDLPQLDGSVIAARDLHVASLTGLGDLFAVVAEGVDSLG